MYTNKIECEREHEHGWPCMIDVMKHGNHGAGVFVIAEYLELMIDYFQYDWILPNRLPCSGSTLLLYTTRLTSAFLGASIPAWPHWVEPILKTFGVIYFKSTVFIRKFLRSIAFTEVIVALVVSGAAVGMLG